MSTLKNALIARRKTLFRPLLAAAGVLLAGCHPPQSPSALPPTEVDALEVQPRDLPLALEYAAQLRGLREVEVRARVSGILLERRYEEGQAVKANDLLFLIDPAPFRAEAERARAEVGVQRANLQQATRERDRIVPLFEKKLASQRDRDTAIAAFESAQAALAAAEAALRTAELNLSYTEVRAPISGLTSREVRSEGSLVNAADSDSSLLAYLVQADRLYVDVSLPEGDAELVRTAHLEKPRAVRIGVLDTRGRELGSPATIEYIAPRVDQATGTVAIRGLLDNTSSGLLPGQVVRARIEGVGVPGSLVIPKRALMHGAQGPFVWVIGSGDKVEPHPVALGATAGNDVVVTSGLTAGDRVVVDGILKVQPGGAVHATMLSPDGTAPPGEPARRAEAPSPVGAR